MMTDDEIDRIEQTISRDSNNCGGCETCLQYFGIEPLMYDAQTVWNLIKKIRSLQRTVS